MTKARPRQYELRGYAQERLSFPLFFRSLFMFYFMDTKPLRTVVTLSCHILEDVEQKGKGLQVITAL